MKINKQQIIVIGVIILGIIGYIFLGNNNSKTTKPINTASSNTTNSGTINIPESEKKGTQFLLKELKEKIVIINPDLIIESAKINGNYVFLKFKCEINNNSIQRLLSTTKDKTGNIIDIKTISAEQISLLKKNMETDCNIMNSVFINKGMLFVVDNDALSYKQITPSVYFDKLLNILPVDFSSGVYGKKLQVISSIFSYEENINQILNDKTKIQLIRNAYNEVKKNIKSLKLSDVEVSKILGELDILIDYYTK